VFSVLTGIDVRFQPAKLPDDDDSIPGLMLSLWTEATIRDLHTPLDVMQPAMEEPFADTSLCIRHQRSYDEVQ
jgi:hypothetical protein